MKRQCYRLRLLICILIALWLMAGVCIAEENKLNRLTIRAKSFDYSPSHDWGFYSLETYFDPDRESGIDFPIEYIGMSMEQQNDLSAHPENWYKCWIRLQIQPGVDWETTYCADPSNPLHYVDLRFENVRISNADEVRVYPKPFLMFAANPAGLFDEAEMIEESNGNLWYMEVMIEAKNRTEAEITRDLQQAEVFCDATYLSSSQCSTKKNVPISLTNLKRQVCFEENAVQIHATQLKKSDEDVFYIFSNYIVSDAVWDEVCSAPENFNCYELDLVMTNNGKYPILGVETNSAQYSENVWLVYYELEFIFLRDCKPGASVPLEGYYLIIRDQNFSEEELLHLPLRMEVNTEFAGLMNENEPYEGVMGCSGLPFVVEIDMTSCKGNKE